MLSAKRLVDSESDGLYLWVGHRSSDVAIVDDSATAALAVSCYGSWSLAGPRHRSFVLEDKLGYRLNWSSLDQSEASKLLNDRDWPEYAARLTAIIPYRADVLVEQFGKTRNVPVKAVPSSLFNLISTKSFLLDLAKTTSFAAPGLRLDSGGLQFGFIADRIGSPFFLKTDDTVSGNGCFYVESPADLKRVITRFGDNIKSAWQFLEGASLNFHFCIDANATEVLLLPPSCQIIRLAGKFGRMEFLGNDFGVCQDLDPALMLRASRAVLEIAQELAHAGYRGVGGADVISTKDSAWVVDINPRFQGSSALLSRILASRVGITLGRLQILSFADEGYGSVDRAALSKVSDEKFGAQIIVKNGYSPVVPKRSISAGVYAMSGDLKFRRSLDSLLEMADDEIAVLDTPRPGLTVAAGAPLGRVWIPARSPVLSMGEPVDLVSAMVSDALQAEE